MGIFDHFEYKENYQNEEKVIEVLKKILKFRSGYPLLKVTFYLDNRC